MKALITSLGMFSIIPVPAQLDLDEKDVARAVGMLPGVGLVIGLISGATCAGLHLLGVSPFLSAAIAVAIWALCTGGFHLDGLADTNDGLASRKSSEEALEIMKKHDIGPMGVATIVLVLLIDFGALAAIGGHGWALVAAITVAPMICRVTALAGTGKWVKPARATGLGAMFVGATSVVGLLSAALISLGIAFCAGLLAQDWQTGLWLGVSAIAAWFIGVLWQRRLENKLGGMTGDTLGSLIEISQMIFLVAVAILLEVS